MYQTENSHLHKDGHYSTINNNSSLFIAAFVFSIFNPFGLFHQKKYKEDAEKDMPYYVPVADTPEMQRVRENQKNFSMVRAEIKKNRYIFYLQRKL